MQYAHEMLLAGKIPLKNELIQERVTYHDPCNIARSGRITEEPREILQAICRDFVEMTPNRTENYCCGGGGGTVSIDEIRQFRTGPLGKRKAVPGPRPKVVRASTPSVPATVTVVDSNTSRPGPAPQVASASSVMGLAT